MVSKGSINEFFSLSIKDKVVGTVHFYISKNVAANKTLPIVLYIQGSGCCSHFKKERDIIKEGYGPYLNKYNSEKFILILVEKIGVEPFFCKNNKGTSWSCPKKYLKFHTLENWSFVLKKVLETSCSHFTLTSKKLLLIGHSEGGIVSSFLANQFTEWQIHLALFNSTGLNQAIEFYLLYTQKKSLNYKTFQKNFTRSILTKNKSSSFYQGHPIKRWHSFLSTSTYEQLLKQNIPLFIVHGTADKSVPVESIDMMCLLLQLAGKKITYIRIKDANHGLVYKGENLTFGMFNKAINWFLRQL